MPAAEQVALVTSGASLVGQAVAKELLRRGFTVVLQGASQQELEAAAGRLGEGQPGERIATFVADPAAPDDREDLVEFVLEQYERIDLLVGIPAEPHNFDDLLELRPEAYEQVMSACVAAPLFLTQRVANEMVRLTEAGAIESAKIVLVNSIGAYATSSDRATHCLASAAAGMITRLFADRLSQHGVNVYEVRAGLISSGEPPEVHARYDRRIEQGLTPIRRWGRPQDVALAVAAVAEDLLPYSTGQVIHVDGGFHLRRL